MNQVFNKIKKNVFGYKDNKKIYVFRLINSNGNYVELTNYGAAVKSIVVPDKFGNKENVALGYPTFLGYESDPCYIGSTVGPFANRIANAKFKIGHNTYYLDKNDGANNNHSGSAGFNTKVFDFLIDDDSIIFTLKSPHCEGGFPGNLEAKVIYKWSDENKLNIEYFATTDLLTPVNFTNHTYFNLTAGKEQIHNHKLDIASNTVLECHSDDIPTGATSFIGNLKSTNLAIIKMIIRGEYNKYFIFNSDRKKESPACTLYDDVSGRTLNIYTTYPGLQLYTGQFLRSKHKGTKNRTYKPFDGLCLECQYYPDSPNHSHFPNTLLKPSEIYNETITYAFDVES
ncbi:aldose epimerase family protein [Flavivirga sp. 57AJ16]|uniref:aldose epimerase family protein n=1 Tax=Flavivirga sp. 57AJ16 TaxID=3025307 RepID=UPI0023667BBF|nr:aldose epimerase family protein [Flavivirga sp. 57AJ16]MDD7885378.1 galactose mutarotase [Flavivirga sp. 57AJ16]